MVEHSEASGYIVRPQDVQSDLPARPQGAKRRGGRFGTLSPLSDVRTPLEDGFNILPGRFPPPDALVLWLDAA